MQTTLTNEEETAVTHAHLVRLHFTTAFVLSVAGLLLPMQLPAEEGRTVRVAAVSFRPQKFDLEANAKSLESAFRQAKQGKAELAVAPEGALDGYVVNEIIAGKAQAVQMREVAVPIDGPAIGGFRKLAA